MIIKQKDKISAIFLLLLGLFVILFSIFRMSVWKSSGPVEGFFPLLFGTILVGLSIILLIISCSKVDITNIRRDLVITEEEDNGTNDEKINPIRAYEYLFALLFYVILFEEVGFIICSGLLFIVIIKFVEKRSYLSTLLVTLITVSFSYFLFNNLLAVPLPWGILKYLWR